jgi:3D (Asp-Asp-Asp) domain-containing protein
MSRHAVVFDAFLDELQKEAGFKEVLRNAGLAAALTAGAGGQDIKDLNIPKLEPLPEGFKTISAKLTNYCPCPTCCEGHAKRGINRDTAYGGIASQPGAAVDPSAIPKRSWLFIPGKGWVVADDTGGGMRKSWEKDKTYHIDQRSAMSTHLKPKVKGKPTAAEINAAIKAAHKAALVSGIEHDVPVVVGPPAPRKGPLVPPKITSFKETSPKDDLIALLKKYNQEQFKLKVPEGIPENPLPESPPVRKPAVQQKAPKSKPAPKVESKPAVKKPAKAPAPLPFLPDEPKRRRK